MAKAAKLAFEVNVPRQDIHNGEEANVRKYGRMDAEIRCGKKIFSRLLNEGPHVVTIDSSYERPPSDHYSRGMRELYTVEVFPCEQRQMAVNVFPDTPLYIPPQPTLGQMIASKLRGFVREMTSPVVYDGPRG